MKDWTIDVNEFERHEVAIYHNDKAVFAGEIDPRAFEGIKDELEFFTELVGNKLIFTSAIGDIYVCSKYKGMYESIADVFGEIEVHDNSMTFSLFYPSCIPAEEIEEIINQIYE